MAVGPAAAVLGGYKGASVEVVPRHRAEGSETNPCGVQLLHVLLMLSELALAPVHSSRLVPS